MKYWWSVSVWTWIFFLFSWKSDNITKIFKRRLMRMINVGLSDKSDWINKLIEYFWDWREGEIKNRLNLGLRIENLRDRIYSMIVVVNNWIKLLWGYSEYNILVIDKILFDENDCLFKFRQGLFEGSELSLVVDSLSEYAIISQVLLVLYKMFNDPKIWIYLINHIWIPVAWLNQITFYLDLFRLKLFFAYLNIFF